MGRIAVEEGWRQVTVETSWDVWGCRLRSQHTENAIFKAHFVNRKSRLPPLSM